MKIVHLNTSDLAGGAARAAYRLHTGLLQLGIDSHMLVQKKLSNDPRVHGPRGWFQKALAEFNSRLTRPRVTYTITEIPTRMFSTGSLPDSMRAQLRNQKPDAVNIHWINSGFMRIETLRKFPCPVVWTVHDMWPFTGGCHYSAGCRRYEHSCGKCPVLKSSSNSDLSRKVWRRKSAAWMNSPLQIVTPSHWMAACARASSLFRDRIINTIPNGLDTHVYKPVARRVAREILNLPPDKEIILFGADSGTNDPRKGFDILSAALECLAKDKSLRERIAVVTFGGSANDLGSETRFLTHHLGCLHDDVSLSLAYSAATLFVAPSREDNLPNTVLEAMACGTPCVGFNVGGIPDLIQPGETGYLADPFYPEHLAAMIRKAIETMSNQSIRDSIRDTIAAKYSLSQQAKQYSLLYNSLL